MFYVYFLTNAMRVVLYVGMTNNLQRRLREHTNRSEAAFTGRYNACYLIYWEEYQSSADARARELEIKKWSRKKKERLIATKNPEWKFLDPPFS